VQLLAAVEPEGLGSVCNRVDFGWELSVRVGDRVELSLENRLICRCIEERVADFAEAGLDDTLKIEKGRQCVLPGGPIVMDARGSSVGNEM
jgi:hypothetical protein